MASGIPLAAKRRGSGKRSSRPLWHGRYRTVAAVRKINRAPRVPVELLLVRGGWWAGKGGRGGALLRRGSRDTHRIGSVSSVLRLQQLFLAATAVPLLRTSPPPPSSPAGPPTTRSPTPSTRPSDLNTVISFGIALTLPPPPTCTLPATPNPPQVFKLVGHMSKEPRLAGKICMIS